MPRLRVLVEAGHVCNCLRNKTMFYEPLITETDTHPIPEHHPKGPFWCAITQSLIGPDGGHADADACRPGRGCCETA
jgi:hypothetical protein